MRRKPKYLKANKFSKCNLPLSPLLIVICAQMNLSTLTFLALTLISGNTAHKISNYVLDPEHKFDSDKEPTLDQLWGQDWPFSGVNTFAHLPYTKCLLDADVDYDIAVVGVPFDTATTFRPGARFGPSALRSASQRQNPLRGFNYRAGINPFDSWAKVVDCGDIPVTPMDNALALKQMTKGYETLLDHKSPNSEHTPRLIMLGGDHSIILPGLRSLYKKYGQLTVIHFDAHLDTWLPEKYPSFWHSDQSQFTHGSMLWMAHEEGLLSNDSNLHVGLRTRLTDEGDLVDDDSQGFQRIFADDIFKLGVDGIVSKILKRIPKDVPVYISVDIDVLDPGFASGTGTPEVGGLLSRELIYILRALEDLNIVGADLVEVSPAYDNNEITALAGAQVIYEIITNIVKKGPLTLNEPQIDQEVIDKFENLGKLVHQMKDFMH